MYLVDVDVCEWINVIKKDFSNYIIVFVSFELKLINKQRSRIIAQSINSSLLDNSVTVTSFIFDA